MLSNVLLLVLLGQEPIELSAVLAQASALQIDESQRVQVALELRRVLRTVVLVVCR